MVQLLVMIEARWFNVAVRAGKVDVRDPHRQANKYSVVVSTCI